MNFLDKIEEKIFDWVLAALGCVLAALGCYLICYKRNVDNLKTQAEELRGARDRLQRDVDTAISNLKKIEDDVKRRLTESDDIIAVAEKILEDDNRGWYLNMMSRYQVSKRADKAASEAKNLKDEISKINSVGYRESTQVVETVTSNRGYEVFESRRLILTDVLKALENPDITSIGVYGMGGIGKTMLVKEVLKQAEKEKLFDKYLFLVVSNDPDLKRIQREISEQLDLKLEVESELVRRDQLRKRLKQENKVLIILDDIWKYLDLETLGIFFGDDQKGCKLLLTSRLQNTLRDMGTQKQFPVGVLSDNDAISLFEKIVGYLAGEFKSNMPQIVKECAGLPIAITTVANALKNRKNIDVWKYALNQLKMSHPITIVGTDDKAVYESIKLSYEFLSDEEKSLLLLCSLHGEDYNIMIEDLLKYAVGWDLLKNDHKIEDARSTVHKSVEGLKDSCLLLDGNYEGTVKMHDVIRDVVIYIAAEEKHMFTIRTAIELQNLSKREDVVGISLPYINNNLELPNQFECSKLELLLLFSQKVGFRIPDSFFDGLKDLKVLKLSGSWFGVLLLPSSLSSLENLQTLCLDGEVQNAIIIGELKNLKALTLSLSNTERLPKEIGQLTHLQLLDLGKCFRLKCIPPNVLSNLKRLEELYLPDYVEWEVEVQGTEKINAMVSELDHLSHLTKLHICIENAKILPKPMVFERLESYRIAIGSAWYRRETWETSRILKLKISFQSDCVYEVLLRRCETLILGEMRGVKNILYELDSEGFQSLKHLTVEDNNEIQYIIKSMGVRGTVFPILESIKLRYVNNLERISYTRLPTESFCNLRVVKVSNCRKLEFVFSSSMVGCFSHLQEMNIEDCEIMSAIVAIEREEEIEVNSDDGIMFANLHSLKLRKLFKLMGFLSVVNSHVLFNGKVVFPILKKLEIEGMDSMNMIWPDLLISDFFGKLETLTISSCTNLSPYLFLLCAEGFTALLEKAFMERRISGVSICRSAPKITNLLFADDSLLFCQASQSEVASITEILQMYAGASGQSINLQKSSVFFSKNTPSGQKQAIVSALGVKEVEKFDTYLGLPTLIGRAKYQTFSFLKDRVWKKLQGWKGTILSRAGKEVLIKAVAQSIPTYTMGVFLLPLTLCDDLNALCAKFWWGQVGNERKVHWQSWDFLSKPKKDGGMGFRDFRSFNLAMLAKQGWRLIQDQDSLLFQCLKARYFPRCNLLDAAISPNCSYTWRSIVATMPILKSGCCWRVGDGLNIRGAEDKWIPNHPTNKILFPTVMEDKNWCVVELIEQDLFWWNRDLIYANFHKVDADAICKIPLSRRSVPDAIFWLHSKDGVYSCKSGYQVARQIARELDWTECSKGRAGRQVWQRIWKLGVPNKIKLFGWRACQEILPTRVNLAKRKIIDDNLCQCCGREPETEAHVLWECGATQDVWAGCGSRLQKMPSSLGNVVKLFETLFDRLELPEVELFFVQAWFIWNQRNTVLHGGSFKDPKWLNKRARDYLKDYQQAQRKLVINEATTGRSIWQPPPQSCFKLNFDAAIFDKQNCTGIGAVIRNNRGEVMAAMSAKGLPVTTSYEAEALACRKALEFSIDAGFLELIIEGDNAHVMKSIGSSIPNQSALGIIIDDVKCLINGMQNVYVSSIRREGNMVAHALARFAKNVSEDLYWLEDDPPPVVDELYSDMLNLNE